MDSIYVLIPVTTILLGLAIAAYLWSVNSGQFDDLDKASQSILFDDTDTVAPKDETPATPPPAADAGRQ
ncbi:MAG: cbb3-type cytochrome oxidase assembly protein CcoS [Gammaproteobacteria bacterium]|jgi:cbb3-type cytochrome oxidase maturation protein|nr:cbb3-type cytochrome oxidase assembly protein CcoS [Gammaproteobacteria bacterium]MBK8992117.1 cbb3-type cytochrome oxidase assembly protein CcoS [Gammaproteobacteria bacterium]MBK9468178.1 cbb3-type cytochrome oxidase assembly protein CcoS [Gammaproteobacteria bacterium]MBP6481516.1 cbb3-type cytochrome oxidase assembly protein CcoS [Pseudomonadales bacterium]MBP7909801.1 cbb3-type cytochrome oxidase assembly protein CcoS [Pseudomonadales bacterium]